jgi:hypothetical protein
MRSAKQQLATDIAGVKAQLAALTDIVNAMATKQSEPPRGSYTRQEFQLRHHLSERQYFKLKAAGKGPREMKTAIARGIRISVEADAAWVVEREAEAAEAPKRGRPRTVTVSTRSTEGAAAPSQRAG